MLDYVSFNQNIFERLIIHQNVDLASTVLGVARPVVSSVQGQVTLVTTSLDTVPTGVTLGIKGTSVTKVRIY